MSFIIWLFVFFGPIAQIRANQLCYTNVSFSTGKVEICEKPSPFCCYDISGEYYCCESDQLLTIIKTGSSVFGFLFGWSLLILFFFFVFVEYDVFDGLPPLAEGSVSDSFSLMFAPEKKIDEKKDENKETNTEPKSGETATEGKEDSHKAAWAQYANERSKSSSTKSNKIGFKEKSPKAVQSVDALKAAVNEQKSKEDKKNGSKSSSKKSFNENVEKMKKSVNK